MTKKWMLQPVRHCCKGSQLARVTPACFIIMKIDIPTLRHLIREELGATASPAVRSAETKIKDGLRELLGPLTPEEELDTLVQGIVAQLSKKGEDGQ